MKTLIIFCLVSFLAVSTVNANIINVMLETNYGDIELALDDVAAPITVANFVSYVNDGFYNGLLFHRVIADFVIQGGGYDQSLNQIAPTYAPIVNESYNGLKNLRGTLAMARTTEPHSATSQFFINHVDNQFLDFGEIVYDGMGNAYYTVGYCVFGEVIEGMDVVDAIAGVATETVSPMTDVPVIDVVINNAYVVPEPTTIALLTLGGLLIRKRRA